MRTIQSRHLVSQDIAVPTAAHALTRVQDWNENARVRISMALLTTKQNKIFDLFWYAQNARTNETALIPVFHDTEIPHDTSGMNYHIIEYFNNPFISRESLIYSVEVSENNILIYQIDAILTQEEAFQIASAHGLKKPEISLARCYKTEEGRLLHHAYWFCKETGRKECSPLTLAVFEYPYDTELAEAIGREDEEIEFLNEGSFISDDTEVYNVGRNQNGLFIYIP